MSEAPSFEEALEELETSVERLESAELSLEEALQVFEAGIAASKTCAAWLERTRQRVQVLVKDEGGEFQLNFLDEEELEKGKGG